MKIKILEWYQGTQQPTLKPGEEHDSAQLGKTLTDWLIAHGKAEVIETDPVLVIEKEPKPEEKPQAKKPVTRARRTKRGSVKNESD